MGPYPKSFRETLIKKYNADKKLCSHFCLKKNYLVLKHIMQFFVHVYFILTIFFKSKRRNKLF
jgi:hypothetical protein